MYKRFDYKSSKIHIDIQFNTTCERIPQNRNKIWLPLSITIEPYFAYGGYESEFKSPYSSRISLRLGISLLLFSITINISNS